MLLLICSCEVLYLTIHVRHSILSLIIFMGLNSYQSFHFWPKLNQQKWQQAILNNENLRWLTLQLEEKQKQLAAAQEPYIEMVQPESRVYIK